MGPGAEAPAEIGFRAVGSIPALWDRFLAVRSIREPACGPALRRPGAPRAEARWQGVDAGVSYPEPPEAAQPTALARSGPVLGGSLLVPARPGLLARTKMRLSRAERCFHPAKLHFKQ